MITKYWKIALSLLFTLAVFLFWVFPFMSVLGFQEQYQMFLFDTDYFLERVRVPGGLADYIAEFITQFNYVYALGAALLALLFFIFQRLTWVLFRKNNVSDEWYALSFLPALLLWWYMSDENVMLSFLVSLIAAETVLLIFHSLYVKQKSSLTTKNKYAAIILLFIFMLIVIPGFYQLFGASVWVVAGYCFVFLCIQERKMTPIFLGASILLYTVSYILAISYEYQYPLYRMMGGINYYRYPAFIPSLQIVLMVVTAVLPSLAGILPSLKNKLVAPLLTVFVALGGGILVYLGFSAQKYDIIEYDYLVRAKAWNKIIDKATKNQPQTPLEVACVNLALSQQGQLGDRMFEFYQNGGEGLFPTFNRDMLSSVSTAEVYYHLGMVNDAQRYMFEAQEAIPNFRKSARLTRRIIDCEIINGNYAVAEKLLRKLEKTLFYADWAKDRMTYLRNEAKINADEEYGKLRKYRYTKDFLFSDQEMDQMLGLLFSHCYENRQAYEYLMAYELVQRDMTRFMQYYPIGRFAGYKDHIPYAIQQALVLDWTQKHNSFEGMPYSIESQWMQMMQSFVQTYMQNKDDASLKEGPLAKTFWSYMLVNKSQAKKSEKDMKEVY